MIWVWSVWIKKLAIWNRLFWIQTSDMVLLLVLEWTYQETTFLLLQNYSYKLSCVIHLGQGVIKLFL